MATVLLTFTQTPCAQIWSTDRTEEAANARAREERERRARTRGETMRPTLEPQVAPASAPDDPPRPSVTPTAPNTTFSAPAASAAIQGASTRATAPSPTGSGLASQVLPRDFGLTLGDIVQQRIALPAGTAALSQPEIDLRAGRIGTWMDRLHAHRESDTAGREWLVIEHQVVNVARMPRQGELPAQSVMFTDGTRLDIAPRMLGLAPVASVSANVRDVLDALRPDHAPPLPDVRAASRQLRTTTLALAAIVLGWLLLWRWHEWRDAQNKPFARALREMRGLPTEGKDSQPAWVSMHHALNAAAGRSVQAASIEQLYSRQPALRAEHDAITGFFNASNQRFFSQSPAPEPFDLPALARRLRALEKKGSAS
jgi:mxaA protein